MSDDEVEEVFLVCVPIAALPIPREGSVMSVCQKCEAPVWVSENGIDFINENPTVYLMCTNCAIDTVGPEEFNSGGHMVPGAPEWMAKALEAMKQEIDLSKVLRTRDDE